MQCSIVGIKISHTEHNCSLRNKRLYCVTLWSKLAARAEDSGDSVATSTTVFLRLIVCGGSTKEKSRGNINTSTLAAGASGRAWIRSRKPPQYASCESWSMPQRNPIKSRVLLKVNLGHGRYCQYYCHFSRVEWFKYWIPVLNLISRRDDCAFLHFFFLDQNQWKNRNVLLCSRRWPSRTT